MWWWRRISLLTFIARLPGRGSSAVFPHTLSALCCSRPAEIDVLRPSFAEGRGLSAERTSRPLPFAAVSGGPLAEPCVSWAKSEWWWGRAAASTPKTANSNGPAPARPLHHRLSASLGRRSPSPASGRGRAHETSDVPKVRVWTPLRMQEVFEEV